MASKKRSTLIVKRSGLQGAGKGLFTTTDIKARSVIVEYTGIVTTWASVSHDGGRNKYIFFVNRNNVIDARSDLTALARYANDARGLTRIKGVTNNAVYAIRKGKVFIEAIKNIAAGDEIFVGYGKEYWDTVRFNDRLEKTNRKAKKKN